MSSADNEAAADADPEAASAPERKIVNLALQGGGSHGAFTWGVLDRLLEESELDFDGISGTSAGAVNAVVLADGLAAGGREGAREALRRLLAKGLGAFVARPFPALDHRQGRSGIRSRTLSRLHVS